MTEDAISCQQLTALWHQAEQAARGDNSVDDWVVVLEFAPKPGDAPFDLSEVDALVEWLWQWDTSALYNPDRYAIQFHVNVAEPDAALQQALAAHRDAVTAGAIRGSGLVRGEILTLAEFENDWSATTRATKPASPAIICSDMHKATRALVAAATPADIEAALLHFGAAIGADIHLGG